MYGVPNYYQVIRELITEICKSNREYLVEFQNTVEIRHEQYINTKDYIEIMGQDGNWATNIDISVTAYIYNINIAVYIEENNNKEYQYAHLFTYDETNNINLPL